MTMKVCGILKERIVTILDLCIWVLPVSSYLFPQVSVFMIKHQTGSTLMIAVRWVIGLSV